MSQRSDREIEIFGAALELPAGERARYLTQACGGEPDLLRRVEELLKSDAQAGSFLESPAPGPTLVDGKSAPPRVPEAKAGDRIGRYKLLQQIGEGGCGVVFMAEQEEPVRRRVALKVIKLGMDTKNVIARFEAERQALAMMDHPHIARVLDAGATDSGRPYFVMELVRGIKITDYCDENNLSTRERLKLFMQVCRAVQHAHQKGIIHRDIKPSNVLVTSNDGEPIPKVIDFGIAKAAQGKLTDRTLVTAFEQFIGTPAYMSPEQAELSAVDIDTRSDIYSLGVLLYELLAGQTPFDAHLLREAGLDEVRRTIREKEPARPSTRLNSMPRAALTIIAKRRQLDAPALVHSVKGDLDWIVMKALEKNRARRYETANGFAADIQRYLNNEPVVARPPGKFYAFQKMARRHKLAFAAGALALFTLIVCLAAAVTALVLINGAKKETTEELRNTYLASARATRLGGQPGRRSASLAILKKAAAIRPGPDVRDEAIASLAVSDLEVTKQIVIKGHGRNELAKVDLSLEHYAVGETNGNIIVRTASNDQISATLSAPGLELKAVVAFSPGGRYLNARYWRDADGESDLVWDLTNQTAPVRVVQNSDATNRWNYYYAIDFSDDDRFFFASHPDGGISEFELPSGRLLKNIPGPHPFNHLCADPAGGRLACVCRDNPAVEIRDLSSGRTLLTLNCPPGVSAAAWSFDGKRLATAGLDFKIYIWDASNGRPLVVLPGHSSFITKVAFNHGGNVVASSSFDDALRLWNPESGRELARYHGSGWDIRFSDDDRIVMGWQDISKFGSLAVGGSLICRILDVPRQRISVSLPAFSADGRILAIMIDDDVCLLEAETGRKLGSFPLKGGDALVFPPDGKSIITVDRIEGVRQRTLELAEAEAAPVLRIGNPRLIYAAPLIQDASLSRDGHHLAITKQADGEAVVLDLENPAASVTLRGHPLVSRVALSPDGLWAATGAWNNPLVKVWDARTGDLVRSFTEPARALVNFSPDGRWLATSSSEYKLWEVGSWQLKGAPQPARDDGVGNFTAFTSDGRLMARTEAEKIQLQTVPDGQRVATLEAPGASTVLKCQFSPDGTRLAAVQNDKQVQLWDLRRLRNELAEMHLDWDQPAFPPIIKPAAGVMAVEIEPQTNQINRPQ